LSAGARTAKSDLSAGARTAKSDLSAGARSAKAEHEERKRTAAEQRKRDQAEKKLQSQITDLETRIAEREQAMKDIEATMSAPGFYDKREEAQPFIDRHQSLMWELGDLMHRWEELQQSLESARSSTQ
jgi:predicted  nucleic acid-binding Zn-ribbon protein